jgi:hypothetical protein
LRPSNHCAHRQTEDSSRLKRIKSPNPQQVVNRRGGKRGFQNNLDTHGCNLSPIVMLGNQQFSRILAEIYVDSSIVTARHFHKAEFPSSRWYPDFQRPGHNIET